MHRALHVWIIYFACLALAALAVGWLSVRALNAEQAEETAQRQATLEENTRLALWRMDSLLAPFLAQENARPTTDYEARFPGNPAAAPAPMRIAASPLVRVYFCVDPAGTFRSPQVDDGISERLAELGRLADRAGLLSELPSVTQAVGVSSVPLQNGTVPALGESQAEQVSQQKRAGNEFRSRSQLIQQSNLPLGNNSSPGSNADVNGNGITTTVVNGIVYGLTLPNPSDEVQIGSLNPIVRGKEILLARRADNSLGQTSIQGAWLDWTVVRGELLSQIADLLPAARLEVLPSDSQNVDQARLLASLPVRLDPGSLAADSRPSFSPVRLSLMFAWGGLFLAATAVAVLLRGVVTLSERRADFVSAVTHELRTPLTTFRMYAEMLAEGMVDETKRRDYLQTLRGEAERLTHLVENVLAYARLERNGLGNRTREVTVASLLSAATERLGARATQAGMQFEVDADENICRAVVSADPSAVEQILFNLVDNACKYARRWPERSAAPAASDEAKSSTLQLEAAVRGARLQLRLRDHGPGISAERRRRLFQPFRKSADDAARSAPGVGLGLALSRRLAREMEGALWLDESVRDGAAFVLELPLA